MLDSIGVGYRSFGLFAYLSLYFGTECSKMYSIPKVRKKMRLELFIKGKRYKDFQAELFLLHFPLLPASIFLQE